MASHHKRERSPFFWISYLDEHGKQKWYNTKLRHDQEDEARALCASIEKQIKRTTPDNRGLTVEAWAERWFEAREKKIKSSKDDKSRITKHVLPTIGALPLARVRKADVQAVFDQLRAKYEATGKPASGTIKSIYAAVKMLFADAVAADLIESSPLFLTSHTLPSVHKKPRLPYTLAEIEKILFADPDVIPDDRRTLYAVLFFFGLRFGEGAALTWADFDTGREPLACMNVTKAYSVRRKTVGATKTETKRPAPVHPVCYYVLQRWRDEGFPAMFGRAPEPRDLLVPSRELRCRSSNHGMKRLRQDLQRLGLEHLELRTQHAFRTAFISQMRAVDVDKDKVRAVTHGKRSSGDVIDAFYTVWPWDVLCRAVMQMPFSEAFLHRFYTDVSMRIDSGKWRGGRDSNSSDRRYWALLGATLQGRAAIEEYLGAASVNESFTPTGPVSKPSRKVLQQRAATAKTALEDLEEGGILTLEPLSLAEIVQGLPWADQVHRPSRSETVQPGEYPRVTVSCDACGRSADVEQGPGIWECIFCGGKARLQQ